MKQSILAVHESLLRKLPWIWLFILVVLNLIPIRRSSSGSLSGSRVYQFRLDHLIHASMIFSFALIWIYGKIMNIKWFQRHETQKFSLMIFIASIGLELLQILVPWRRFNSTDLLFNLGGGLAGVLLILTSVWVIDKQHKGK